MCLILSLSPPLPLPSPSPPLPSPHTSCVQLATALLPVCDPLLQVPSESVNEGAEALIPTFVQPKIQGGVLPGGMHYVHAEKPNRGESLDKLMAQEDYVRGKLLTLYFVAWSFQ